MSLPLIKILLLAAIAIFAVLAFRGSRRASYRLLWRGYGVSVALAAIISVLRPNVLTELAKTVGVGRGADLLLYVLVVTFMLVSVVQFRRISEMERRYIHLARAMAIRHSAHDPDAGEQQK